MPTFKSDKLLQVSRALLGAAGASEREANIVSDLLIEANLCGVDSHGVSNLKAYIDLIEQGKIKPGAKNVMVKETATTALVDANWGFGQVACSEAVELVVGKAERNMVSVVGMLRCNHIGRLGAYSEMIAERGMIGSICANSDPSVAPYGGMKSMLGTNPISLGFPAGTEKPIIVDFATSASAEGKIRVALQKGEKIPEGWILDKNGKPTTDPADLYEAPLPPVQVKVVGAQLPMAGHKGFGLALAVDVLGGALTGTGCSHDIHVPNEWANGVLIQALNIEAFSSMEEYERRVDKLITDIKSSPRTSGVDEIQMPGEPEFRMREERAKSGIPVSDVTWNAILGVAKKYGVDVDKLMGK